MSRRLWLLGVLALSLMGCASPRVSGTSGGAGGASPDVFAHRVATSHVVLYWNCVGPAGGVLALEGVAQNLWSAQEVRFLELELVGVDRQGRGVSQGKGQAREILLRTGQTTSFRLELRPAGSEVRYDLFYQYQYLEPEEMGAMLVGHPAGLPGLLAQATRFMARDVCSESQHRAR